MTKKESENATGVNSKISDLSLQILEKTDKKSAERGNGKI